QKKRSTRNAFLNFHRIYLTSKVSFTFTRNSVTLSPLTTALCSLIYTDLIFLTVLEASFTAFFVASSQLSFELDKTSITFNTGIILSFLSETLVILKVKKK